MRDRLIDRFVRCGLLLWAMRLLAVDRLIIELILFDVVIIMGRVCALLHCSALVVLRGVPAGFFDRSIDRSTGPR